MCVRSDRLREHLDTLNRDAQQSNASEFELIPHTGGMSEKAGMTEIADLGPTGRQVASNLQRLREGRNLTYAALSKAVGDSGRKIPPLALRRIEARARRVDADDLVALAVALDVSPLTLLLPEYGDIGDEQSMSGLREPLYSNVLWLWGTGDEPLHLPDLPGTPRAMRAIAEFRLRARPEIAARDEFSIKAAGRNRAGETDAELEERLRVESDHHARRQGVNSD